MSEYCEGGNDYDSDCHKCVDRAEDEANELRFSMYQDDKNLELESLY